MNKSSIAIVALLAITVLSSPAFATVNLHRSLEEDGVMRVRSVPVFTIAAQARLVPEPGGLHLMMQPLQPTRPGDNIELIIELEDGSLQSLIMTVRK